MSTFLLSFPPRIPSGAAFLLFALLLAGALTALICSYAQKRSGKGRGTVYLIVCLCFVAASLLLCFRSPEEPQTEEEDPAVTLETTERRENQAQELALPSVDSNAPAAASRTPAPKAGTEQAAGTELSAEPAGPAETEQAPAETPAAALPEETPAPEVPETTAEPEAPKTLKIPEDATVAPKPDEDAFGETDDPDEILAVIDAAAELLDGRETIWSPDIERMNGSVMRYYRDDTILVITWKEAIDGAAVTFAEVFIADGSQIRRALAGNAFGGGRQYASEIATGVNAVVAMNGDYYNNRQIGLSVYQREINRTVATNLDTCFVNTSGDLLMSHAGALANDDQVRTYMEENDVLFAVSFGPILVEDGEKQTVSYYPVGEIDSHYSRSAIAQKGELHYLLMTMGEENGNQQRYGIDKEADILISKGVDKAYALDGGGTAEIVMQGRSVNRVDWDRENLMSDIIYFATAIPEDENEP